MALSFSIVAANPASTEDFIILALSQRFPLSAKEIYSTLRRGGFEASYQAVHKKLKELEKDSIIVKDGRKYLINRNWILNAKSFLERMDRDLIRSDKKVEAKEAVCLSFDSYNDFSTHMLEEFVKERELEPGGICVTCQKHFYWILSISKRDYALLRKLGSGGKSYIVCEGNSPVDKLLAPIYRKLGWKVVTGIKYSENYDLIVYRDWIHQIFFSEKQKRTVEKFCKQVHGLEGFTSNFYKEYFENKGKIKVIIFKDCELARQLRADALKYFKNVGLNPK